MRRNGAFGLRLLATAAAMAGVFFVSACDGENLFTLGVVPIAATDTTDTAVVADTVPPSVGIIAPRGDSLSAQPLGDSVFVSARVTDDVALSSVRLFGVALRGNKDLGTDVVIQRFQEKVIDLAQADTTVSDTTIARYLIATADRVKETAQIVVEATDVSGNVSTDTVGLILGGPDVDLLDLVEGQQIHQGLNLNVRFRVRDPVGIVRTRLEVKGAFSVASDKAFPEAPDSLVVATVVGIPNGVTGPVTVIATAWNNLNVAGQATVGLNLVAGEASDTLLPLLLHSGSSPARMELKDSLLLSVSGSDDSQGSGIARLGYTVQGSSSSGTGITSGEVSFSPPLTGTATSDFVIAPPGINPANLPDTLTFLVTSWMVDAAGNCAAAVGADTLASLPCATLPTGEIVADGRTGETVPRIIVAGHTALLPGAGGKILDAVVDTFRHTLLLANFDRDRVEVFDLEARKFGGSIPVGAAPWGLSMNNCYGANLTAGCGDTLVVANAGGTNLSMVYLGPRTLGGGGEFEDENRRLLTPDMLIFNAQLVETDQGDEWAVTPLNVYSDRPQFVAMDVQRQIHYSTWPTSVASGLGTLRRVYVPPGGLPEVVVHAFQFARAGVANSYGIVNLDYATWGQGRAFTMFDHVIGTTIPIQQTEDAQDIITIETSVANLRAQGSDVVLWGNPFAANDVGFGDTTFVAAAGSGRIVLFGEGGVVDGNRILVYDAPNDATRFGLFTEDLQINKDDRISGLGVNQDGTLAMGRGDRAYFFTEDLRLQGEVNLAGGGIGAALHPLHANALSLDNPTGEYRPDTHIAFVGSSSPVIEIYDTFHFFKAGEIDIASIITGPLRASLPFPGDNAGLQCPRTVDITDLDATVVGRAVEIFQGGAFANPWPVDGGAGGNEDRCVVLKLYGLTATGGVVSVNVRKRDILRNHPSRN